MYESSIIFWISVRGFDVPYGLPLCQVVEKDEGFPVRFDDEASIILTEHQQVTKCPVLTLDWEDHEEAPLDCPMS